MYGELEKLGLINFLPLRAEVEMEYQKIIHGDVE